MALDPPTTPIATGERPDATVAAADTPPPANGAPTARHPHAHHAHRILVTSLLALATLCGLVSMFSIWANRQALNTKNWTSTSTRLIADPKIETALGNYLVAQLFANVNVSGDLQGLLPKNLSGLAGPAAGGLREVADQVAPQLLASSVVQNAWTQANTVAHRELLNILNGGGKTVGTKNGEVTLNLNTIIDQLAQQLGFQAQLAAARAKLSGGTGASIQSQAQQKLGITVPTNIGQLVILKSNNLKTAQDIASAIRGLAVWLTVITLALFALAVWLARGWRRVALRSVGWCFVGLGVLVVLLRRVIGNQIVSKLVAVPANRPAALDAWRIATSLLYDIALAVIVYGLVLVIAAWLAGGTRPALAVRRALAPELRVHPVAVYSWAGGAFLLLLIWGPTPAFRQLAPIIGIIVLLILGLELLRRQTAEEFPDTQLGDTTRHLRAWWADRHDRRHGAPNIHADPAVVAHGAANSRLAELERLSALHDRGVLSDEEFAAEKATIMSRPPT